MAWHPIHESLMLSGGYNGSLIYWLAGQNQVSASSFRIVIFGDLFMDCMLAPMSGHFPLCSV